MKRLLLLTFIIVIFQVTAKSQRITFKDSINYELSSMRYNLNNFHKEYKKGLIFVGAGTGATLLFSGLMPYFENPQGVIPFIAVGGILTTIGTYLMIDANKHIGRASIKPTYYGYGWVLDF